MAMISRALARFSSLSMTTVGAVRTSTIATTSWMQPTKTLASSAACSPRGLLQASPITPTLTTNTTLNQTQQRFMKTKASPKLRCPECKFVRRKGRTYVVCKKHPRHKARQG
eukprot:m.260386 g.260386  ORF g.260386 m.260386 type:complete len:112 (+) comp39810_c0_seq1:233-568(+)